METNDKQAMDSWTGKFFERPVDDDPAGYPEPSTPEPSTIALSTVATDFPVPTVTDIAETGVVLAVAVAALSFAYTFIRESVRNAQAERNGFLEYLKATIAEQQKEYQQIFAQMRARDEHYLRVLGELSQAIKDSNRRHREP